MSERSVPFSVEKATIDNKALTDAMGAVAAAVTNAISAGLKMGLTHDAVALAAQIGVLGHIRVEGLNEEAIIREARRIATGTDAVFHHMRRM